jgi:hypothetical protein
MKKLSALVVVVLVTACSLFVWNHRGRAQGSVYKYVASRDHRTQIAFLTCCVTFLEHPAF